MSLNHDESARNIEVSAGEMEAGGEEPYFRICECMVNREFHQFNLAVPSRCQLRCQYFRALTLGALTII